MPRSSVADALSDLIPGMSTLVAVIKKKPAESITLADVEEVLRKLYGEPGDGGEIVVRMLIRIVRKRIVHDC